MEAREQLDDDRLVSSQVELTRFALLRAFAEDLRRFSGRRGTVALVLVAVGSVLEGVGLLLLVPLLAIVLPTAGPTSENPVSSLGSFIPAVFPSDTTARLIVVVTLFLCLVACRGLVLVARDTLLTRLQAEFVNARRLRVVTALASCRWSTIARLRHGRISHLLGADVASLRAAAHSLVQIIVAFVMLAGQCAIALWLSPLLALSLIVLLAAAGIGLRPLLDRARRLGSQVSAANLDVANHTIEFLNSLKISISQNLQRNYLDVFEYGSEVAAQRETAFARQRAFSQAVLTGAAAALACAVLLLGIPLLRTPTPSLIALVVVLARMNGPAMQVQQSAQHIFNSLPAFEHLQKLEQELALDADGLPAVVTANDRITSRVAIDFHSVRYLHEQEDPTARRGLRDVSLRIAPGEFLGLAGASGSGKTTFADLLVGLYEPQFGSISVGGAPLKDEVVYRWRESISYISQDPFLYHMTIRQNLVQAAAAVTEDEMWQALRTVEAEQLIMSLSSGLDTVVGERGSLFSGGERQRLALARALVRKPVLLVLDEATNALDIEKESAILSRLAALPERPTIVIIGHRPSTFTKCDRTIELRDGEIAGEFSDTTLGGYSA